MVVYPTETLDALGIKMESMAMKNKKSLDIINKLSNKRVFSSLDYSLSSPIPPYLNDDDIATSSSTIDSRRETNLVSTRIKRWEYKGEPLKEPDDIFNDGIDYTMRDMSDVVRLNDDLFRVANKYVDRLADRPKNRQDLRMFIENMEKVEGAIRDLRRLTKDMKDPVAEDARSARREGGESLSESIKDAMLSFNEMIRVIPGVTLSVSTELSVIKRVDENEDDDDDDDEISIVEEEGQIAPSPRKELYVSTRQTEFNSEEQVEMREPDYHHETYYQGRASVETAPRSPEVPVTKKYYQERVPVETAPRTPEVHVPTTAAAAVTPTRSASAKRDDVEQARKDQSSSRRRTPAATAAVPVVIVAPSGNSRDGTKESDNSVSDLVNDIDNFLGGGRRINSSDVKTNERDEAPPQKKTPTAMKPAPEMASAKSPSLFDRYANHIDDIEHLENNIANNTRSPADDASRDAPPSVHTMDSTSSESSPVSPNRQKSLAATAGVSAPMTFFAERPPSVHTVNSSSEDSSTTLLNELPDECNRTIMSGIEKKSTFAEGTAHEETIMTLAPFSLDKTVCLASGSDDGTIKLWDLQSNTLISTLEGHDETVTVLTTFTFGGVLYLASGSEDKEIMLWDLRDNTYKTTLTGHSGAVRTLSYFYSVDVKCLASGSDDATIVVWNLANFKPISTLEGHSRAICATATYYEYDTPYLASGGKDRVIKLWNLSSNKVVTSLESHLDTVNALTTFFSDGVHCLASGSDDLTIKLWNITTHVMIATLPVGSAVYSLASFKSDEIPCLGSGDASGKIMLWNIMEHNLVATMEGDGSPLFALTTFEQNGVVGLASGRHDGKIELWME